MTDDQKAAIQALSRCSFVPASFDKRFARQMSERLEANPGKPLTKRQAAHLAYMLHRYRGQHKACPCDVCTGVASATKRPKTAPEKFGSGQCPCGARGTLFRRKGDKTPPRCAVCCDFLPGPLPEPDVRPAFAVGLAKPVPPKPYPWLGEEKTDNGTMRRFCLACGDCAEIVGHKCGKGTSYPGFVQWYREHIHCGPEGEAKTL